MPYINLPPALSVMFDEIDKRLRRLETAYRFTVPIIAGNPTYPKEGDMWINSTDTKLYLYYNGIIHNIKNL